MNRPASSGAAGAPLTSNDHRKCRFDAATTAGRPGLPLSETPAATVRQSQPAGERRGTGSGERVWITAVGGRIVGMIRLWEGAKGVARVRCVRIDPEWQHTSVPKCLADRVGSFCRHAGYVRVAFAKGSAPSWFKALAERRGFANLRSAERASYR